MMQVKLNQIARIAKQELILAFIANVSLKSRVWENRKHGSVGVTIALRLILI